MVNTNLSTLHTIYNIMFATQGSNDTTHTHCHAGRQQQPGLAQSL